MHRDTLKGMFSSLQRGSPRGSEYGGYVDYEFEETRDIDSTPPSSSQKRLGCASHHESTSQAESSTTSAPVLKRGSQDDTSASRPRRNVESTAEDAGKCPYFIDTGFDYPVHTKKSSGLKEDGDEAVFFFRVRYALLMISCILISVAVVVLMVRQTTSSYYEAIGEASEDVLPPMTAPRLENPPRDHLAPTTMTSASNSSTDINDKGLPTSPEDDPTVPHRHPRPSTTGHIEAGKQGNLRSHGNDAPLLGLVGLEGAPLANISSEKFISRKKNK